MFTRIIVWLRQDLRLKDNYALNWAMNFKGKKEIIPVFCYDPRIFFPGHTKYGTRKTGAVRAQFQNESVEDLRASLQQIGSNLLVSSQKPEDFLVQLLNKDCQNAVIYQQEICSEELKVEANVKAAMKKYNARVESIWGSTLYHIDDLDYNPKEYLPNTGTQFMKSTYNFNIRDMVKSPRKGDLPYPLKLDGVMKDAETYLPSLKEMGHEAPKPDKRACLEFKGGETHGLKRIKEYMHASLGHYAATRNGLLGSEYSSKLSPWLANGCVSIRDIYYQTVEFEKAHGASENTRHFIDELLWRDFSRYWCMRFGNKVFSSYGILDRDYYNWQTDEKVLQRWKDGQTGMPLVDALMREMNQTGFMSNRGRQIVACYLTMDLKQDWRYGAHYFEEKLIDSDVHSNYHGWSSSSGIGSGRVYLFNTLKQSRDFDKDGEFIKLWCPELKDVPVLNIHDPWTLSQTEQKKFGIGDIYPLPIDCPKYTNLA